MTQSDNGPLCITAVLLHVSPRVIIVGYVTLINNADNRAPIAVNVAHKTAPLYAEGQFHKGHPLYSITYCVSVKQQTVTRPLPHNIRITKSSVV